MEGKVRFDISDKDEPIIKVIGVGGGGGNAVNYMYKQGIKDVSFMICNTDSQALENSPIPLKIQLGASLTEGRGAGNKPDKGKQSAIENIEEIKDILGTHTKMVFITAGMGGGTGTGAAPVIAKVCKDMGILTVAIVTIPFRFEGKLRVNQAIEGVEELKKCVDSILVINNEKLSEIYGDLKLSTAFSKADDILTTAAKGIAEIITLHGYINVDFEDVKTVMTDSGIAVMGSSSASGEGRAKVAISQALTSPLLSSNDIRGAKHILLNITSGEDEIRMDEVGIITDYVQEAVGENATIIWGTGQDTSLGDDVTVTIIATGFVDEEEEDERVVINKSKIEELINKSEEEEKLNNQKSFDFVDTEEENLSVSEMTERKIKELETEPAYKRRKVKIDSNVKNIGDIEIFTLDDL